jgi:Domain of unknown function (DUF4440)
MRNFTNIFSVVVLSLATPAISQSTGNQPPGQILTPTRQVTLFSDLENQLMHALQKKDAAALQRLLDEDFEISEATRSNPIAHEELIDALPALNLESFLIRRMSAHDFSETVSVDFVASAKGDFGGKDVSGQYYIVDLWRKSGDSWRLAVRYLSKITSRPQMHPKPTGKN